MAGCVIGLGRFDGFVPIAVGGDNRERPFAASLEKSKLLLLFVIFSNQLVTLMCW
jgi:hypothetical protein